jgi:hypothetical protein
MKLDPDVHIGLHLAFFRKTGATLVGRPQAARHLHHQVSSLGSELMHWAVG